MKECVILEHPFWSDFVEAFRSAAVKEVDPDSLEELKQLNCRLFPASLLEMRWEGWEMGIHRPPESFPKEWVEIRSRYVTMFLVDFFKRVKGRKLYCDYSAVAERFGEEKVANRMGKKTGLHLNLEGVYWTLNVKFNRWIDSNIRLYDCSLVCELDEILTAADGLLREAFFPTPGPFDIGPRKRKKLQQQMLRKFAPL